MSHRKSYEASCELLQEYGLIEDGDKLPLPVNTPNFDDAPPLGVSFFRERIENCDLGGLTLPRTFIGRSELRNISFQNTNLREARLCWNDFITVDFRHADLAKCDLRASVFQNAQFNQADLCNADLRHATFHTCDFSGAKMKGAKLAAIQGGPLELSVEQAAEIDWQPGEGSEPPGG